MRQKRENSCFFLFVCLFVFFSPNLCDRENCTKVNRKTEDPREGERVCGLGDLNSILSTELEVQMGMPSYRLQI